MIKFKNFYCLIIPLLTMMVVTCPFPQMEAQEIILNVTTPAAGPQEEVKRNKTTSSIEETTTEGLDELEELEVDEDEDEEPVVDDDEAAELRGISLLWGTYGTQWALRVPEIEKKIVHLYVQQMKLKSLPCNWTEKDEQKWIHKFTQIKRDTWNSSDDAFGLEPYKLKRGQLQQWANWTLEILEEMETITNSLVSASKSDDAILKFGGYLRETMMMRKFGQKLIHCQWTNEDRVRAGKKVSQIMAHTAGLVLKGLADHFGLKVKDIISPKDRKAIKDSVQSHKQNYEHLFQPFYSDDS